MSRLAQALLQPDSVALVGASDDPKKTTSRPLRYLSASGYGGRVYPVNPRRDTIDGHRCYPALADLPEVPEHVYVMTGTERAIEAVAECGRLGVPVATVLADGFAEAGPEGREREDRLRAAAGATRLVGPNSLGVINPRNGLLLTANAAFAEPDLGRGDTFVASHSGSVVGALVSRGLVRGICFAGLVSTGGEANLSLGEICLATVDDPGITSYALFLESLRHADDLARFAAAAAARGKPVVAYKLGRSEQGAQLSVSHTGAMAGADDEADAFFNAYGVTRVDHLEALIEAPALVSRVPAGIRDPRVAVITTTGGGAALVVDRLGLRGIGVRPPSEALRRRLRDLGAPLGDSLIMDLTLAGARHEIVSGALDELQRSGEYDLIVMVVGSSARFHPELAVSGVIERAGGPTPLAAFAVPEAPDALAALSAAGIPAFRTPESIAEAIAAAATRPTTTRTPPGPGHDAAGRIPAHSSPEPHTTHIPTGHDPGPGHAPAGHAPAHATLEPHTTSTPSGYDPAGHAPAHATPKRGTTTPPGPGHEAAHQIPAHGSPEPHTTHIPTGHDPGPGHDPADHGPAHATPERHTTTPPGPGHEAVSEGTAHVAPERHTTSTPSGHQPGPGREPVGEGAARGSLEPGAVHGDAGGVPGHVLDEPSSYRLLARVGIAAQPYGEIGVDDARAGRIPDGVAYPVAVKALSAALAHKTEAGGVELNVPDAAGVAGAAARIAERTGVDRLLVTEMAPDGTDALIGYRVSPEVGPLIMVAAGGVLAELYRDTSLRLAPVDLATAHAMIAEVTGLRPVLGYRGSRGDADALARAITALSTLAEAAPDVVEAEVNPLRVLAPGDGVTALDALVRRTTA